MGNQQWEHKTLPDHKEAANSFQKLAAIMDELRTQCPWDKKQTIQSLRQLTLEETYELADAIDVEDWQGIKEELGDIMLHLLFYSRIGKEQQAFTLVEMLDGIADKLIHRHPHIYGNVQVADAEEVKLNWEKLKLKEGKTSVMSGVPKGLPALVKAMRIQEKAKQVGFEWKSKEPVWEKVLEEIDELKMAVQQEDKTAQALEFGDVLFSLINYARFLEIDAEQALAATNQKFLHRFTEMEKMASAQGKDLTAMRLEEMDALWNQIKRKQ